MSIETDFLRYMSRHLVALTGTYELYSDEGDLQQTAPFTFSGFVLKIRDQWFWTTAGHCLEYLNGWCREAKFRVFDTSLVDYFGTDAKNVHAIPFPYEPEDGFFINNPDIGLDFGLVPLGELFRKNLESNGVQPITRKHWVDPFAFDFEVHKILGFPSHLCNAKTVQPVLVSVKQESPVDFAQPSTWFAGRVEVGTRDLPSIVGMSGGPICGFVKTAEGWGYQVVAIQSCWHKTNRVTFGCRLSTFAEAVRDELVSVGR